MEEALAVTTLPHAVYEALRESILAQREPPGATVTEKAVAEHEKSAPSYSTLRSCEATEGRDRCERTHIGNYRPVLLAFLVVASKPPVAKPLYASGDPKKIGFRSAAKDFYLTSDDAVTMSEHAQTLAEAHVDPKAKKKSGAGG